MILFCNNETGDNNYDDEQMTQEIMSEEAFSKTFSNPRNFSFCQKIIEPGYNSSLCYVIIDQITVLDVELSDEFVAIKTLTFKII